MAVTFKVFLTLALFVAAMETKTNISLDDVTAVVGERIEYQIGDKQFLSTYNIYRVVERGTKHLPSWLTFDHNSSMLVGTPVQDDVGIYAIRMKALCIDPSVSYCQDRLSRTFHINVVEPLKTAESRGSHTHLVHGGNRHEPPEHAGNTDNQAKHDAAPDREPELQNSIDHLPVYIGRYFEFKIPENTFMDHEDGNTRNLTLSISLVYGKQMPRWAWLMFNSTSQTLYGIPLKTDFNSKDQFTLVATDSQGQSAKDVISLTYKYEVDITHRISVQFNETFSKYKEERQVLVDIAQNIASFYNDNSLKYLTVLEISDAPLTVVWGNHSLFGEKCFQNKIQELYDRLADANGSISESFENLFSNYTPLLAKLNFDGVCLLPLTTAAPPTKSPMSDARDKMWIEIVLPALIVVLVIVIVALLLLICCRHRRPNKDVSPSDKPAFLEDRRPIIFPEELEMVDPSLKPNKPLILPSDYLADFPPAVPPHGRLDPPTYRAPVLDDDVLMGDDTRPAPPPPIYGGTDSMTDPPPYRLPPPYFNPHRHA